MRRRPAARTVIYGAAVVSLIGATLIALVMCLRGGAVPSSLVNSRIAAWIASRYDVRFSLDSLHIGCFRPGCTAEINAEGINFELDTPEPLRVHVDGVQWCRTRPLTARALRVRAGNRPDLVTIDGLESSSAGQLVFRGVQIVPRPEAPLARIDAVDVSNMGRTVTAAKIRIPVGSSVAVLIDAVTAGPLTLPDSEGWFRVSDTKVSGVRLQLADQPNTAEMCAEMHSALSAANDSAAPLRALPDFINHAADRVRQDLLYAALGFAAIVFGLKLLSVLWMTRWRLRLALALTSAFLPFLLYYSLHRALRAVPFLLTGAVLIVGVAVLCRFLAYRAGPSLVQPLGALRGRRAFDRHPASAAGPRDSALIPLRNSSRGATGSRRHFKRDRPIPGRAHVQRA